MQRLLLPLLAALAASAAGQPAPRVVVLVTLDTTRADHLGAYGYPRPTTPFIDALARRGVVFENAFSPISHTAPSHATIFTGLYPAQHGVRSNGEGFPDGDDTGFSTLAERFEAAGYRSAAFTSVRFLAPITRGFGYVNVGNGRPHRPAGATIEQVVDWLKLRRRDERIFAWIHLFDPHQADRAPEAQRAALAFASDAEAQRFATEISTRRGVHGGVFDGPLQLAAFYAGYDAQIRYADSELGRLHAWMQRHGFGDDAWWIVTADHGEGLGQHGHRNHGRYVYDEQLRVPLIVSGRGVPAGRRVSGLAHLTDLWPSLADLLGQESRQPTHELRGLSLLPSLTGTALPARQVYAERRPRDERRLKWERADLFATFDLDWKYIAKSEDADEFYDRRSDPLELQNRIAEHSPVRERLAAAARAAWAQLKAEGARYKPRPADPKALEELRALGYVNQ